MDKELDNYCELTDISFDAENAHLAICHKAQGGSANGWHDSVLLKAEHPVITADVIKAMKELGEDTTHLELEIEKSGIFKQDLQTLIGNAINAQEFVDKYDWAWVCDWNDDTIIFCCDDGIYSVDYTMDGVEISVGGTAKPVCKITDYVEINGMMLLSEEEEERQNDDTYSMVEKASKRPEIQVELLKASTKGLSASDFAYVPDKDKSSTWKLNISSSRHVAAAVAALGKGFRGQKVQIPSADLPAVKSKVKSAYKKYFPKNDLPDILKSVVILPKDSEDSQANNGATQIQKSNTEPHTGDLTVDIQELMKSAEFADLLKARITEATAAKDADLQKAAEQISILKAAEEKRKEANLVSFAKSLSYLDEAAQADLVKSMMTVEDSQAGAVLELTKALGKANETLETLKKSMTNEVGQNGETKEVDVAKAERDALNDLIEQMNKTK